MADVLLVDNMDYLDLHFNAQSAQVVPNPTYGKYELTELKTTTTATSEASSPDSNEVPMEDYQCVSDVNPNYSTVDISKKTKFRYENPESRAMQIPGRSNGVANGNYSVPRSSANGGLSISGTSPSSYPNNGLSNSVGSCGSPTPLLPPRTHFNSQTSQISDLSSSLSNSECGEVKRLTPTNTSSTEQHHLQSHPNHSREEQPFSQSSEYSYARHPSVSIKGKNYCDQSPTEPGRPSIAVTNPVFTSIDESLKTDQQDYLKTVGNVSYGKYTNCEGHPHRDDLKVHDLPINGFEVIIGIFAVVTILVSLVVIVLVAVLVARQGDLENTSTGSTTTIDQSVLNSNGSTFGQSEQCSCPAVDQVHELQVKLIKLTKTLQELRQNLSLPASISSFLEELTFVNTSVVDLNRSANEPKNRTSNLDLNAGVYFNTSLTDTDCIVERITEICKAQSSTKYICRSGNFPLLKDGRILVEMDCYMTNILNNGNITGNVEIAVRPDISNQVTLTGDDPTRFQCYCSSFNKVTSQCNVYTRRCAMKSATFPVLFST